MSIHTTEYNHQRMIVVSARTYLNKLQEEILEGDEVKELHNAEKALFALAARVDRRKGAQWLRDRNNNNGGDNAA